jgi:two-component system response regulator YesN
MDIKMPGLSGIEAAKVIKKNLPECKIVFLSAYNYFDYAKEALKIGASDFLIKPVSCDELIEVFEKLIKQKKLKALDKNLQISNEYKFKQVKSFFQNEFIHYLLFSECKEAQIYEYFDALNIKPAFFHTLIMILDSSTLNKNASLKVTILKRRCMELLKNNLAPYILQSLGSSNKNILYLLINTEKLLTINSIKEELTTISKYIKENFEINNRIILSSSFSNVVDIKNSFITHKYYLQTHIEPDVICLPCIDIRPIHPFSKEKEKEILESIMLCNETTSLLLINDYINWLFTEDFTIDMKRFHVYGFLTFIVKSFQLNEDILKQKLDFLQISFMKNLQNLSSKSEFQCFLDEQIHLLIHLQNEKDCNINHSVIEDICAYINTNYAKNINLSDISDLVNLNSQYISKRFKEEKGITFSHYLTHIRIKHAKKLLLETTKSINDISEEVGYNDPNYFTRAFKHSECMSPKSYRAAVR